MILLIILAALAIWFFINTVATWIISWGLTEITGMDMPFWPVFWILVTLTALFGSSARASVTSS